MQKSPRNKMMKAGDIENKKLGVQMQSFYFPHLKRSVVAENFEEAVAIINKEK